MNAYSDCDQGLLLQAEFDGELDAAQVAALHTHRINCKVCAQTLAQMQETRTLLRGAQHHAAPDGLRRFVTSLETKSNVVALPVRPRKRSFYLGVGSGIAASALLAMLLIGRMTPPTDDLIIDSHLRALQTPAHLLDVVSTDHHTVKPWFAGQLAFSPPVKDLASTGFPLKGGRVDVIDGQSVAVMVYQAGKHTLEVFAAPHASRFDGADKEVRGFNLRHWREGDIDLLGISDLNAQELDRFVDQWKTAQ